MGHKVTFQLIHLKVQVLINLKSIMGDGRNAVKLRYDYLESDGMVYQDRDNFTTQLRKGEMW